VTIYAKIVAALVVGIEDSLHHQNQVATVVVAIAALVGVVAFGAIERASRAGAVEHPLVGQVLVSRGVKSRSFGGKPPQ